MENLLFYTQFSPLNVGNRSLELCSFQIFWGSMPPDTPWKWRWTVDMVGYFIQICWLLQFLLKPLLDTCTGHPKLCYIHRQPSFVSIENERHFN